MMQTGQLKTFEDVEKFNPVLAQFPRFQREFFDQNLWLVEEVEKLAARKGVTPAQVALAWVRGLANKGVCGEIIAIPGATAEGRVRENMESVGVELSEGEMEEIGRILGRTEIKGGRYADWMPVNT
jgi:pyridoxine 4-dehydrogenase